MSSTKKTYAILFIIIFLIFTINLISFKNGHDWGSDFALYIAQAQALVNGNLDDLFSAQEFRFNNSTVPLGPFLYSWGFPILLSPVYYIFGLDINAMKVYVNLFFLLSLIILFLIFKDDLSNSDNLLLIAIIAFNPWFFDFKDNILSDIPFLFFSMLSIFLIKRFVINKKIWISTTINYILIGISIFLSFYIREIGIFLLPTLLISQYIENNSTSKNLKTFLLSDISKFIPYLIFLVILIAINLTPLSRSTYGRALYEFSYFSLPQLIVNCKYYFFLFSRFFPFFTLKMSAFGLSYNIFYLLIYVAILSIVIFGMICNMKKDYIYIVYGSITLIFLLVFPFRQGARFIAHLFPFFLYFLFIGFSKINIHLKTIDNFIPLKLNKITLLGISLLLISLSSISHATYQNIIFNRTQVIDGPYSSDSLELFNYIKKNTKKDDAIIFFKPRALMLYTDRKSFIVGRDNFTSDAVFNSPARYIIFNKTTHFSYELTIQDFQKNLYCEFENSAFIMCDLRKTS